MSGHSAHDNACPGAVRCGVLRWASGNRSFSFRFCWPLCRVNPFICFGGPGEGFVSFPGFISILVSPYLSGGRYCSVLLSSYVLRGGGVGSVFEGFDFSHEGVKRVVGLLTGCVSVIASAPYCFLYLNQRIHDIKK